MKGIYRDTITGKFYTVLTFRGKKFSKTMKTLDEIIKWRREFHPEAPEFEIQINQSRKDWNGVKQYTFWDAWEKYKEKKFPELERSSINIKLARAKFFDGLMNVKMIYIDPDFLDEYIKQKVEVIRKTMKANRYSLKQEIKELSTVFNWYKENMDFKFTNPVVRSRHNALGVLRQKKSKSKKMKPREIIKFLEELRKETVSYPRFDDPLFHDLAMVQFYIAGRIQEAAAIMISAIDFEDKILTIDAAFSWAYSSKKFDYSKGTKTKKERFCYIVDTMQEIFERRMLTLPKGCELIFHHRGEPLNYTDIYKAYNRALKRAGLLEKFSGTHILRHGMAKAARDELQSLDGAQAVTGHACQKQAEAYAGSPEKLQVEAVKKVEHKFKILAGEAS